MNMSHYGTYWVSFFKGVILVLVILALTGCSIGGEKKIKIFSIEKPREKLDYPMPTALQLEELKWIIITSENAQEVFKWAPCPFAAASNFRVTGPRAEREPHHRSPEPIAALPLEDLTLQAQQAALLP